MVWTRAGNLKSTRRVDASLNETQVRTVLSNINITKALLLLMVALPKPALSSARLTDTLINREHIVSGLDERDPNENMDCLSMGELDISFSTENGGAPNVGVVLTDPRGRRIGFDPISGDGWQELPQADGFIHCDELHDGNRCRGMVQVCGPVSGIYKLEVIGRETTSYSLSISARSKETLENRGLRSRQSVTGFGRVAIHAGSRDLVLLNYSRDPGRDVSGKLHRALDAREQMSGLDEQTAAKGGVEKSTPASE